MLVRAIKNLGAGCIWNRKRHVWTCANGRKMYFEQMTDSHLLNTLRMVEERHRGDFGRQVWAELRLTVQKRGLRPLRLRSREQMIEDQRAWETQQAFEDPELWNLFERRL